VAKIGAGYCAQALGIGTIITQLGFLAQPLAMAGGLEGPSN
jgi:hypothetical protein